MCNIKKNTYNQLSGLDPTWQFARSGSTPGHVAYVRSVLCYMDSSMVSLWKYWSKDRLSECLISH